jgi:RNA recognition motif-containing protein
MSSRVYVGNLDFSMSDQFLREVFGRCDGFISAQTIVSSSTGHPLGFGYVDFRNRRQAMSAVESFDGLAVLGRSMSVRLARRRAGRRRIRGRPPPVSGLRAPRRVYGMPIDMPRGAAAPRRAW